MHPIPFFPHTASAPISMRLKAAQFLQRGPDMIDGVVDAFCCHTDLSTSSGHVPRIFGLSQTLPKP